MDCIEIRGRNELHGEVLISGSKNAAVAIIPAAICLADECVIDNLPNIEDVSSLTDTLLRMGVNCKRVNSSTLAINTENIKTYKATFDSVKKIRASYYFVGALLGRFKKAEVALPGGCNFGSRPIDQHIKGFEALGAKVTVEDGIIKASADKLAGANIFLDVVSVGATINIMLAAIYAEGVTVIENAAKEPHIVDTANFLNFHGANIKGAGTDVIKITGVTKLRGGSYTIIPDQIEAGTYMIATAITGGDVTVGNLIPKHMDSLSAKLSEMNCEIKEGDDFIRVISNKPLKAVNVKTSVYPGFPTDLQPQMTSLLSAAEGDSIMTETIFQNRFQYVEELSRLGTSIKVEGQSATISGGRSLKGAAVTATDLRAGAALIIAGLAAEGTTLIGNVKYIDRGYENIEDKLRSLGADIRRVSIDDIEYVS